MNSLFCAIIFIFKHEILVEISETWGHGRNKEPSFQGPFHSAGYIDIAQKADM